MKSIVLMGIKHCGKSTQARMISEKLGCDSFDTDDVIAEMTGKTPREIYTESGEGEFKKAEVMACRKVCGDLSVSGKRAVIATGGGIIRNDENIRLLKKNGVLVCVLITNQHSKKQDQNGNCQKQQLQLPGPFEPLAVRYIGHGQTDQQNRVCRQDHIGKSVCHTVGQNNQCGRNAKGVGDRQNDGHD